MSEINELEINESIELQIKYSEQIKKMQQDFQFTLSKVSHEIRNPVTLINSFLQLMATKYPQVEEFDYWEDIQENMTFLIDLLNELSTYNNAFRLNKEDMDLNQFLKSVAASVRPTMKYLDIELSYNGRENLPTIQADATKLRETILNIIRNASEAIPDKGHISMELTRQNQEIQIIISDDGPGIPKEYLSTLFDPFVTHKKEGTGLGLAISKQVMEAHGGGIQVSSVPGQGATFLLTLPIK